MVIHLRITYYVGKLYTFLLQIFFSVHSQPKNYENLLHTLTLS